MTQRWWRRGFLPCRDLNPGPLESKEMCYQWATPTTPFIKEKTYFCIEVDKLETAASDCYRTRHPFAVQYLPEKTSPDPILALVKIIKIEQLNLGVKIWIAYWSMVAQLAEWATQDQNVPGSIPTWIQWDAILSNYLFWNYT